MCQHGWVLVEGLSMVWVCFECVPRTLGAGSLKWQCGRVELQALESSDRCLISLALRTDEVSFVVSERSLQ